MYKRILVISNEALADGSSNGRTLKNLLLDISKEYLAQFYIHGTPDPDVCACYYCVSDKDALNAFLHKKPVNTKKVQAEQSNAKTEAPEAGRKILRNYRNLFVRNMVWQSMQWWTKEFDAYLEAFRPEVVLLQAGDAPFMYKIARRIAKKYSAKLMMFNTENYVLKKRMYAAKSSDKMFWHNLQMASLRRQYRKFMNQVDYCTYATEYLEQVYQKRYPHPGRSTAFYVGTQMQDCSQLAGEDSNFSLVYCGNLGVGRVPVLCEMAQVLKKVDEQAKLVIYGKFVAEMDKQRLCAFDNVEYRGFVAYEEIPQVFAKASLVIHCENITQLEDLKAAFSTKIADSLACGKPFLVYATREYPFAQYLERNCAAHVAETPQELYGVLRKCKEDKAYAQQFITNAKRVAAENHDAKKNSQRFREIVCTMEKWRHAGE